MRRLRDFLVEDDQLQSKAEVGYTSDAKMPAERCGKCTHFISPVSCELVSGQIDPNGWCKLFERRIGDK